jgi:hypothetical protein
MKAMESPFKRLILFCEPPPFDNEDLRDEEFTFVVCSGRSEFLCCQLLPCDAIVMTAGHANSEHARSCSGLQLRLRPKLPLLIVMADDPTVVPEHLQPHAIIPERATASELMAVLRNLPWTRSSDVPPRSQRRRFPRYRTNLPLTVRNYEERDLDGSCIVLAEGGLGGILPEPIAVGNVVQLQLALPSHATALHFWAVARYQVDTHHGFEFVSLTEGDRLSVREFCNMLAMQSAAGEG